jgi:large subunit ribosomal protein L10
MLKAKKNETVKTLKDKLSRAKSLIFTNYEGLKVGEVQTLKKKLREAKVEFRVVKNNLFKIAIKESGLVNLDEQVYANPLAVAFVPADGDISSAAKIIYDFKKEKAKLVVKSSLIENKITSEKELAVISQLPPRDVLIARVLGAMKAPIGRLHGVLQGVMRKLVLVLSQIEKQKAEAK